MQAGEGILFRASPHDFLSAVGPAKVEGPAKEDAENKLEFLSMNDLHITGGFFTPWPIKPDQT